MIAQPLAIVGGIAGLWIAQASLNIYSMIDMILLVGLVSKNRFYWLISLIDVSVRESVLHRRSKAHAPSACALY